MELVVIFERPGRKLESPSAHSSRLGYFAQPFTKNCKDCKELIGAVEWKVKK